MAAALTLAPAASATEAPVTAAAESLRTGWYPDEPQLTPQLLEQEGAFNQNFEVPVQGQVYAQPLVSGATLFVATEDNWIYGIDAKTGEVRWERSVGVPWNWEDLECPDLRPRVGVTGTPVIDPSTNTAYFFSKTYAGPGESGPAMWKMHAIDLADGSERAGFPVSIEGEAENLPVQFEPVHQLERPALLLMNGVVYAGFGSHCDFTPFHGWIVGVSATTGEIKTMWAATDQNGASIWMGGAGLASDKEGQLLFTTGNGAPPSEGPGNEPPEGHLGESVIRAKIEPSGTLKPMDFFSPYNNKTLDEHDVDVGSSGPLLLPSPYFGTGAFPHLLVQVGKAGLVYLLNGNDLGGMGKEQNADLHEEWLKNGVWGSLATWPGDGGYVYAPSSGEEPGNGALEILEYKTGALGPELNVAARATGLEFGSGSPIVTSNGTTPGSGVVWISHCAEAFECHGSTLNAYAAVPSGGAPRLLWSAPIGISTKFARPLASGGRIYVGTRDGKLRAFGPTHHVLSVVSEAASGGTVRSDVGGIECGSVCSHSFENGESVTLTATPAEHFEFTGWSGGGCSGTGSCHLAMYEDATVTASFAPITHRLSVSKEGEGQGTVVSRPAGIECGSNCTARFREGSNVVLEALAGPGTVTWSGCTSQSGRTCEVKGLGADRQVVASFLPPPNTVLRSARVDRKRGTAVFRYAGTAQTQSFECRLIAPRGRHPRSKPRFVRCGGTKSFRHLSAGRYTFEVRAVNAAGPDPSPARRRFRI